MVADDDMTLYRSVMTFAAEDPTSDSDDRVRHSTPVAVNLTIDDETDRNISRYIGLDAESIERRVAALDREWDVERILEVNASLLAFTGLVLGVTRNPRWLALPAVVLPFLLLHGVQGWCPPLPLLRRLGVRTRGEIDREKYSLLDSLPATTRF
jgi:hypothetical protein